MRSRRPSPAVFDWARPSSRLGACRKKIWARLSRSSTTFFSNRKTNGCNAKCANNRRRCANDSPCFTLTAHLPRDRGTPVKCPFCDDLEDKVVDSRMAKEGQVIRRRRECLSCKRRYTTYERVEEILPMVVKKDGRRESFDHQKILIGHHQGL